MRVITQTKMRRSCHYDYHYFVEVTAGRWREFCREGNRFGDQNNLPTDDEARFLAAEAAAADYRGTIPTAKLVGFTADSNSYN